METKNKGLADQQDGNIILNESGTSISTEQDSPSSNSQVPGELPIDDNKDIEKKSSTGPEEKDISA